MVEEGVIGDECVSDGVACVWSIGADMPVVMMASERELCGGGGGCMVEIEPSSSVARGFDISAIGDSKTVLETYFGVRGSDDGGDTYGSTPSIGKVWLRGREKLLALTGVILACPCVMKGDAVSEVKNGEVGLCGPGEKDEDCAASVKVLARDALLNE